MIDAIAPCDPARARGGGATDMEVDQIRALRRADPFQPFNLVLRDGRRLPVDRAHYLAISPDGELLAHASVDGGFEWFPPAIVTGVDFNIAAGRGREAAGGRADAAVAREGPVGGQMKSHLIRMFTRRPFEPFTLFTGRRPGAGRTAPGAGFARPPGRVGRAVPPGPPDRDGRRPAHRVVRTIRPGDIAAYEAE
jgi:hypothetical protein